VLRFETLKSEDHSKILPALARLSIEIFREYPFCYDGDFDFEMHDLSTYVESPDARIFLALDGNSVVGFTTCKPLRYAPESVKAPLIQGKVSVDEVLYLGESTLKPEFRGRGIGKHFFELREKHARTILGIKKNIFFTITRPDSDPKCPENYRNLHAFWKSQGYSPIPELVSYYPWREIGEQQAQLHTMQYWEKQLSSN